MLLDVYHFSELMNIFLMSLTILQSIYFGKNICCRSILKKGTFYDLLNDEKLRGKHVNYILRELSVDL